MRNYPTLFLTGLCLSFLLLTVQCSRRGDGTGVSEPAFHPEISAYTAGVVSGGAAIRILLTNEYDAYSEPMAPADERLFNFSPAIKGTAYWINPRTIEFRPHERLSAGQTYQVRFHVGRLFDLDKKLSVFTYSFQVIRQMFSINFDGMRSKDLTHGTWNAFTGTVKTADYADAETVSNLVQAKQGDRMLDVSWVHDPAGTTHTFIVDSIERRSERSVFEIVWDGKPIRSDYKGSQRIDIPGLNEFVVMDARVIQYPEQHIEVQFSDPLIRTQNIQGLIQLERQAALRLQIDGNVLRIFPVSRITGSFLLTINQGLQSAYGARFSEQERRTVFFEDMMPAVRLTGRGVIMPGSDKLVFPFEAVNLRAVDVRIIKIFENNVAQFLQVNALDGEDQLKRAGRLIHQQTLQLQPGNNVDLAQWNVFSMNLSDMIAVDPGAIYRVEIGFKREYALFPCDGIVPDTDQSSLTYMSKPATETQMSDYWDDPEAYWDSSNPYSWNESWYNWQERDDPCKDSYYGRERSVSRNILASNLGIIAKGEADGSLLFVVTDLLTAAPVSKVSVDVYNYQNQLLGTVITSSEGMVRVALDGKPYLLVARYNDQRGYLRLDEGSVLSLSRFDVSGQQVQKGIKGFIYGERGVWRPGDTLHLVFVLEDRQKKLPENHPVIFELHNPAGQTVFSDRRLSGMNGFYYFGVPTSAEAVTGNYLALVRLGGIQFSKTLKIETVKPNRLKIDVDFGTDLLGVPSATAEAQIRTAWLHGAPGSRLRVQIAATLTGQKTTFPAYKNYTFDDPTRSFSTQEITIFDGKTDEAGRTGFRPAFDVKGAAPGMLQANFVSRVFEEGGDFSIDRFSLPYSPYNTYVGVKPPGGDPNTGMLANDTDHRIGIVTVDAKGNPVSRSGLQVSVYKIEWRWWWDASGESLASYMGSSYQQPVYSETVSTRNGEAYFTLRIPHPDWGRYLVRVFDPAGGHSTGTIVYVDWPGWSSGAHGEDPQAAAILRIQTDKETYTVGEQIQLTLPALQQGRALISIESGSRIIDAYWVDAHGGDMRLNIMATAAMAPNVYIYVSFLQPHAQTINDLPIRMYGVVPVAVEDPATRLFPQIDMPDVLRPGTSAQIRIKEAAGKRMTYSFAIVDEGLLDLTRFSTPDIWRSFYAREALGVKTWDLYDFVVGAYGGRLEHVFSTGGDEEIIVPQATQANRFKPVVRFLGPFTLEKGKTNTHQVDIPQYVGAVRAMLIAGDQGAYGNAEKRITVKNPLMVLASLPRVLSPGEACKLPVSIFAMEDNLRQVKVQVVANELFTLSSGHTKQIVFDRTGDQVVFFDLDVANTTGTGKIQVIATSGSERAVYDIEVAVRNPNPPISRSSDAAVEKGQTWKSSFTLPGQPGTNEARLTFSRLPSVDFGQRLKYLLDYPHGCLEQITSAAFPQLFLQAVMDIDENMGNRIDVNIKEAIRKIASYQLPEGSLRFWPGTREFSDWGTSYAGHFMIEAEARAFVLPAQFRERWLNFQRSMARTWQAEPSGGQEGFFRQSDLLQAYRLYTLALANAPELGAMNRLREHRPLSVQARWRLAAAYAIVGQPEAAGALIAETASDVQTYTAFNETFGSRERDLAMMLETLTLMKKRDEGYILLQTLVTEMARQPWMNTQTTAYCLLAISKFVGELPVATELNVRYSIDGRPAESIRTEKSMYQVDIKPAPRQTFDLEINNNGEAVVYAHVHLSGIPAVNQVAPEENRLQLSVTYLSMAGEPVSVDKLTQGTDFMAVVSVQHPGAGIHYSNLVLSSIFPSGWEIHNTRMDQFDQAFQADIPAYQDIRDDRVHTHFDLAPGQSKQFVIRLHAAYLGRYQFPGYFCEAMYDHSVYARRPGNWVEVVAPGQ